MNALKLFSYECFCVNKNAGMVLASYQQLVCQPLDPPLNLVSRRVHYYIQDNNI